MSHRRNVRTVGMYLRTTQRRNKDGSVVHYYALAENDHPGKGYVEARVVHAKHQPLGAPQQGGEAPGRRGRHLPERGLDPQAGRRRAAGAERRVWTALASQGASGLLAREPLLAVVYPASKRGHAAAGPDGLRGSTAGRVGELGARVGRWPRPIPVRPVPPSASSPPASRRRRAGRPAGYAAAAWARARHASW